MKQKAKTSTLHLPTVALALGLLTLAPATAADLTWTGATNADWSDANWNGGTPVDSGADTLTFAGSTNLATNNDLTGFTAQGITFAATAGAFTLAGNQITLAGDIGFSANPASPLTQAINLDMILDATRTITTTANGNLTIGGGLSGVGGLSVAGIGLTLSGSSSYSGETTTQTGSVLRVSNNHALGTGLVNFGVGTVQAVDNDVELANDGVVSNVVFSGTQNLTFSGKLTGLTGSSKTITNDITSGKMLTLTDVDINQQNNTRSLTIAGSGNTEIVGTIAGGNTGNKQLVINSTGTTTLYGTNTYNSSTTVTNGTLVISGNGSINTSSGIIVNGAASRLLYNSTVGLTRSVTVTTGGTYTYNSATNHTGAFTFTSGHLGGTNWNGSLGNLTIGADQTINPGNSPGTAVTTSQTWASLGTYNWEINQATGGTAGNDPGWDLLELSGSLSLTATEASRFEIHIVSLQLDNTAGDAVGFDAALSYQWLIADAADPILGFSADKFFVNTADFSNTFDGTFGVALGNTGGIGGDDSQLYLVYSAVPEPTVIGLLGLAGLGALVVRRRRA